MSDTYRLSLGVFDGVFAVPNLVAERLRFADAKALRPLLYLLRYGGQDISVEELARNTNLSAADVRDGLDYWVGEGLLTREIARYAPDVSPAAATVPVPATVPVSATVPTPVEPAATEPPAKDAEPLAARVSSRPAKLAPGEAAARCEQDPALQFMLRESERLLGRPLTSSDISTLISLVDWAGLSPDLVLMLVGHCRDLGKTNLRYIERVGADWADKGVDSHEKAEALILRQNETRAREYEVMSAFGLRDRALTVKERGYIDEWYGAFGFDIRMVRLAYERAVDRTGKLSFPYIHKVLQSWHEKGFHEPKDAAAETAPPKDGERASSLDLDFAESQLYRED